VAAIRIPTLRREAMGGLAKGLAVIRAGAITRRLA